MDDTLYPWMILSIYAVLGVSVAAVARRRMGAGMNEFFLANRQLGGIVSALTYAATTYSAFMMVESR